MLPLGIYLTKRATGDRSLFDIGSIIEPLRKVLNIKEKDDIDYKFLSSYTQEELLNIITNYKSLGHAETTRFEAFKILKQKGFAINSLRDYGININSSFDASEKTALNYKSRSTFAIIFNSISLVLFILYFIFNNNKLPTVASVLIQLSAISFLLFLIYYIKSLINVFTFYKHNSKNEKRPHIISVILGFLIYLFVYPFLKVKIKEDLKQKFLNSLK